MSCKRGFLPCFSKYCHREYPVDNLYLQQQYVEKVKQLLSCLLDSESTVDLKNNGIGKEIQPIRPDSLESKRIINLCSSPKNLFRIDYGKNTFRIVFSLSNDERMAFIYGFDTTHSTYSGKQRHH